MEYVVLCISLYTMGWIESNFTASLCQAWFISKCLLSDMQKRKVLVTWSRLNGDVYHISSSLQDMMSWWHAQEISFCSSWTTEQQQRKTLSWRDKGQNVSTDVDMENYNLLSIIIRCIGHLCWINKCECNTPLDVTS
jgi:hypothetical protein